MKFTILLAILFDLLTKRRITASDLAEKYGISPRTVYRYVDLLSTAVPVRIERGRNGGICLADTYKLPVGFMTKEEYEAAIEALENAYSQQPEERFLNARRKLSSQEKYERQELRVFGDLGNFLADGSSWGDTHTFSEKMRLLEECIRDKTVTEIEYLSSANEKSRRKVEPHVLVFKQNVWYVYAFCHKQRDFHLFCLGRILSVRKTEDRFSRRPFEREDVLRSTVADKTVPVRFEIADTALADAQAWLGVENIRQTKGKWYGDAILPDDDTLVRKILSFGAGVKVVFPEALRERVATAAQEIAALYKGS